MGGCCSGDKDSPEGDETNRPIRPGLKSYDSDDSSDEPQGILSDDDVGGAGNDNDSDVNTDDDADDPQKGQNSLASPRNLSPRDQVPKLTSSNSTMNAINKNVLDGWKNALNSGNDSLVIHLFEEYKDYDVISIVFENGDNSLHVACQHKKVNLVYFLLTKGIQVNSRNEKTGATALHYACEQRDEKLVKLLLKNNADPTIANNKGKIPFDIARRYRSVKIQQLLKNAAEQRAFAGAFGDESGDMDLDEVGKFGAASDGKRPIARPTELGNKKIGVYSGGLLENSESDIGDSDTDGGNAMGRNVSNVTDKSQGNYNAKGNASSDAASEPGDVSESDDDGRPQTKEEKENQETELELHRIKQRNPFVKRKLERRRTKKILENGPGSGLDRKTSVADNKILAAKRAKLPELEGWLEKRKPRPPYQWQKRWVVVKDTHILWSDKQRTITNPSDQNQRKEFNGFLNINVLQEVGKYESKAQNKFIIKARDAKRSHTREYLWKCPSVEDRNYWVKGLRQYMKYHEDAYKFGIV